MPMTYDEGLHIVQRLKLPHLVSSAEAGGTSFVGRSRRAAKAWPRTAPTKPGEEGKDTYSTEAQQVQELGGMMKERTREAVFLDQHPGVRELVAAMPDFIMWRDTLPVVEVDGETFYVVGGDQLKDYDQMCVAWVNQFRPDLFGGNRD